jgi:hypothetical protein
MKHIVSLAIVFLALGIGFDLAPTSAGAQETKTAVGQETKGKTCRMEQQCHWENFKKICTYVKVCR